jgi:hypothetical protein
LSREDKEREGRRGAKGRGGRRRRRVNSEPVVSERMAESFVTYLLRTTRDLQHNIHIR